MPGSRRGPARGVHGSLPPLASLPRLRAEGQSGTNSGVNNDDMDQMSPMAAMIIQPRHAHLPEIAVDGNLIFEGVAFMYSVMALCLQYINLYKTVWWLPHSNAKYALNFYLIDPYLSGLLVIIMSRRLLYCIVREVYTSRPNKGCLYWIMQLIKTVLVCSILMAFIYTAYSVVLVHSLLYSLFLCYPLVTYMVLFGLDVHPLFGKTVCVSQSHTVTGTTSIGTITSTSGAPTSQANSPPNTPTDKGTPKHKPLIEATVPCGPGIKDIPIHNCTMSPESVRDEVELLKTDFNSRIKQVLFNSMLCAYYMGFVPLCFAQNTLYYDTWWVGQHIFLVWISFFVMFMVHFLPPRYVDVLHRCALHLGHWARMEGRHAHVPHHAWSELQVWPQGALVKHVRGLFKARGINNSAEPGNSMHSRFYFMFHSALRVTNWLLIITCGLVVYQFVLLIQAIEWSHVMSLALLLFCNYYVLFKLIRDRFVLNRAYKDEQILLQQ